MFGERAEELENARMVERVEYVVGDGVLVPHDHEARAQFAKLRRGDVIDLEIFQRRVRTFSNALHLLFKRIGQSKDIRVRNVRGWLMVATGRADYVMLFGRRLPIPLSTNPGEMSTVELQAFWDDARDVIMDDILPTLTEYDRDDVMKLIDVVDRHEGDEP